ncbi:radical SAM protein [Thiorhodococcus mannitoliphagus]|uniref:Radical SAM protein n=1 Tax=Thiorhodococcus mannitoliphagus TaxID=329406 RepID=A0A6P1DZJ2_9GAMM|nr:radical SAM protein [Thiorhodococcus mannitoliphagus]NEX22473.1 radical SAM protein [Thiorhodococcus mannitoliphagus]
MGTRVFSLILLPTLQCNADCEYCFEDKTNDRLSLERLQVLIDKVLDHLVARDIGGLTIHWQGGEVMTLPPSWFARAEDLIGRAAAARGLAVNHYLQTNMIGYSPRWNDVIRTMFGNRVSTSLDYPNLYRRRLGKDATDYNTVWTHKVRLARTAGIEVQVIAVPNAATLEMGAERFYSHFVETLDIRSFQVNTPFPGGESNPAKRQLPHDSEALARFFTELADVWLERGYHSGVRVGPFDELLNYFSSAPALLPCIWTDDCANHILCIDARGNVAQCDCWVASYPDYWFGNIFDCDTLGALLAKSQVLERFHQRPMALVARECIACDYLALCHGGCPVRAFSVHGTLFEKDPHCAFYQSLFGHMASAAARLARMAAEPRACRVVPVTGRVSPPSN